MMPRPLRDVFAELVGGDLPRADAAALIRASGHTDLPDDLVADAIVDYADTAPLEVAEHLTPFVTGHTGLGQSGAEASRVDPTEGLDLLATVPDPGAGGDTGALNLPDLDFGAGAAEPPADAAQVAAPPEGRPWSAEFGSGLDAEQTLPPTTDEDDVIGPVTAPTSDELGEGSDADEDFDV